MVYALNMYVGGALFDTADKFAQLYGERLKHASKSYYQDFAVKGVNFLNLKWILYVKNTNQWYSPQLAAQIDASSLKLIEDWNLKFEEAFEEYDGTRFIVQTVEEV